MSACVHVKASTGQSEVYIPVKQEGGRTTGEGVDGRRSAVEGGGARIPLVLRCQRKVATSPRSWRVRRAVTCSCGQAVWEAPSPPAPSRAVGKALSSRALR